jgi:hypothetical protein
VTPAIVRAPGGWAWTVPHPNGTTTTGLAATWHAARTATDDTVRAELARHARLRREHREAVIAAR